jgi:hypothetical protein
MSPSFGLLNALGPLSQICLPFTVQYANGRELSFRTVHQNGCGDWVVTVSINPEFVRSLVLLPRPKAPPPEECGAPAVLPMPPAGGGKSFMLPSKVDCNTIGAVTRPASPEEQGRACVQWPAMCPR